MIDCEAACDRQLALVAERPASREVDPDVLEDLDGEVPGLAVALALGDRALSVVSAQDVSAAREAVSCSGCAAGGSGKPGPGAAR